MRYLQIKYIGGGSYSDVYEGVDVHTNKKVALKITKMKPNEGVPSTALREITLLKRFNHPNILKLLDVVNAENTFVLVFEFVEYDLLTYISKHTQKLHHLVYQLLVGVAEMHSKNILHRDLKPQNILVNECGILKIADLGLAKSFDIKPSVYNNNIVTLWYRSPELLKGCTTYDEYIDMWSIGCIIVEMITKQPLFEGYNEEQQITMIENASKNLHVFIASKINKIPHCLYKIIIGCLQYDPKNRITANIALNIFHNNIRDNFYN